MSSIGGQRSRIAQANFNPSIEPGMSMSVKTMRMSFRASKMAMASSALNASIALNPAASWRDVRGFPRSPLRPHARRPRQPPNLKVDALDVVNLRVGGIQEPNESSDPGTVCHVGRAPTAMPDPTARLEQRYLLPSNRRMASLMSSACRTITTSCIATTTR